MIKELESFTVEKLHIDPENYSQLIGARGKKIKQLIDQFKVDIKIPNDDSEMVTISGADKNVEACKAEILKTIALIVSVYCKILIIFVFY
jgi:polyribonucleotide nucleotidyltransferase